MSSNRFLPLRDTNDSRYSDLGLAPEREKIPLGSAEAYATGLERDQNLFLQGRSPKEIAIARQEREALSRSAYESGGKSTVYRIGESLKQSSAYLANPVKIVGDIASVIFPDQTLIANTSGDISRWDDINYNYWKTLRDLTLKDLASINSGGKKVSGWDKAMAHSGRVVDNLGEASENAIRAGINAAIVMASPVLTGAFALGAATVGWIWICRV